jgi:hypothetical protein
MIFLMNLVVYGRDATTIFDLLGSKENDTCNHPREVISISTLVNRYLFPFPKHAPANIRKVGMFFHVNAHFR